MSTTAQNAEHYKPMWATLGKRNHKQWRAQTSNKNSDNNNDN